jgi:hypothetical protein
VAARLLHVPPPLATRGFTRHRKKKTRDMVDLTWFHPFFPSSPTVTCNKKKENAGS